MFWSYLLNIPLAFAMLLVFLFAMTDVATATTEAFPFVWILLTAFKFQVDAASVPPEIFSPFTWTNFEKVFQGPYLGSLGNSGFHNVGALESGMRNVGNSISGLMNSSGLDAATAAFTSGVGNVGSQVSGFFHNSTSGMTARGKKDRQASRSARACCALCRACSGGPPSRISTTGISTTGISTTGISLNTAAHRQ